MYNYNKMCYKLWIYSKYSIQVSSCHHIKQSFHNLLWFGNSQTFSECYEPRNSPITHKKNMEPLIFGSFVVLAFVALIFHFMAKQTDDQKKSVSNANFVSFQRSFFLVYFMALLGDWLQGPYVYKLYSYYGYPESQVSSRQIVIMWEKLFSSLSFLRIDNNLFLSDCSIIRCRFRVKCAIRYHDRPHGRYTRTEKNCSSILCTLFLLLFDQAKLRILYVTHWSLVWRYLNLHVVFYLWILVCVWAYRKTRISIRVDRNHILNGDIMEW